jgi:hypothetical protein
MTKKVISARHTAIILFFALLGCYVALSPGSIAGQGYAGEQIDSGLRMLSVANAHLKGLPVPPMVWSRHGPLPVLFDLPFLKLGKSFVSPDFMLSFSPPLFTAGLAAILYLWLRKLCSPGTSLFLALTAAFGTMLWPYAYIGLETQQSLFMLLAGYVALAGGNNRRWPRILLFAAASAFAISVKSTGITLGPVIAFLLYVQFRDDWRSQGPKILTTILIIASVWTLSHWGTNAYWLPRGGGSGSLRPWLVDSALQPFINLIGIFGSPTKGLFVYAPVLMAAIYAVPRAYRTNRDLVIYALLVTGCTLILMCLLKYPADETWGGRYMHLAVAPLILCIGAAWPRMTWRQAVPLVVLAILGAIVSFLGAFYYYGVRDFAMQSVGQNTFERITGDNDWNHILFNARLFHTWISAGSSGPVVWTPSHIWIWTAPPDAPPWKGLNLLDYCQPQSFLVRFWHVPKSGVVALIFALYFSALLVGVLGLAWTLISTAKDRSYEHVVS